MILIELQAATDEAGTLATFYVSTDAFVTGTADTPANQYFMPRIVDPGYLGVHAFADGMTAGKTQLEVGEIVLANADGGIDGWLNYSFDGRPVTIRYGTSGAYPSGFQTVLTGTVDSIEATWKTLIVRLRDKQFRFERPAVTNRYGGTNSLPGGIDGTANDIKGKVKPKCYGKVLNVQPPCVNTSKLAYQVHDGAVASIDNVYDRGATLTKGSDFATDALLLASTPGASTYNTCIAEGLFMLGSTPNGQVTADVTQGAAASNRTAAQIIKQLALDAGLTGGEISSSDVTAMDTSNSAVVGIWLNDETTTFQEAMGRIANSVGAFYGFDSSGTLRMGILTTPSGSPVVTLYDYDIEDTIERKPTKNNGIPIYRATVNHTMINTVQTSDIAGAVTVATRAYLAEQYRSEKAEDTSIKTQYLLATELNVDSLLTSSTDASTEASRLLALYKVRHDMFEAAIQISVMTANSLKLLDVVALQLTSGRFGMSSAKSFRIIGYRIELAKNHVILTIWA